MLASRSRSLFVEVNDFSVLTAVCNGLTPPLKIEAVKEFKRDGEDRELQAFVQDLGSSRSVRYVPAACGVHPKNQFFRRHTLETSTRVRDASFFSEILQSQFQIDMEKNTVAVLNAKSGSEFDFSKGVARQKELLFCGAPTAELRAEQAQLVGWGIYPQRLEMSTLAGLGGILNYLRAHEERSPTLVLEISPSTSNLFICSPRMVELARPIPYGLNSMFPLIQEELGLKDEESARKLLYSNTFDFTEMGPTLLRRMLKELQASTGFYEVQTGQTIGKLYLTLLPRNLSWIENVIARSLGVDLLKVNYGDWLKAQKVSVADSVNVGTFDSRWHGLISLIGDFAEEEHSGEEQE